MANNCDSNWELCKNHTKAGKGLWYGQPVWNVILTLAEV